MGLMETLKRIPKIVEANINKILDECEDPAAMIDQMLVDYKRNLVDVKKDTAEVKADLAMHAKKLEEINNQIARKTTAAQNALKAGAEDDARQLLAEKQQLEATRVTYQENYDLTKKNADELEKGYRKLVADISILESRADAAKGKISLANAQKQISNTTNLANGMAMEETLSKYEQQADRALAEANAMASLDGVGEEDLTEKYAGVQGANTSVDDELAKMKADMGLQ